MVLVAGVLLLGLAHRRKMFMNTVGSRKVGLSAALARLDSTAAGKTALLRPSVLETGKHAGCRPAPLCAKK